MSPRLRLPPKMSEEKSVYNVLFEAANYLCKLGNNLKTRSENLKDKRINKDKLKNSHSVQKVADKILVICDLSKKSIANVEDCVSNVLNVCSANSQSNIHDKSLAKTGLSNNHSNSHLASTSSAKKPDKDFFQGIKLGTKPIRLPQHVSLKHYKSCKVHLKNMSLIELEKYPVYCNCKLYQDRLKKQRDKTQLKEKKTHSYNDEAKSHTKKKKQIECVRIIDDDTTSSIEETSKELGVLRRTNSDNKSDLLNENYFESNDVSTSKNDFLYESQGAKSTDSMTNTSVIEKMPLKQKKITDYNSTNNNIDATNDISLDEQRQSDKKLLDNQSVKEDTGLEATAKNIDITGDDIEIRGDSEKKESESSNNNEEAPIVKPLLKCVDINKLLKSDLRDTKTISVNVPSISTKKSDFNIKRPRNRPSIKPKRSSKVTNLQYISSDDEEYLKKKRKELVNFQARSFKIILSSLPEFSDTFMMKHNISKIIQNNSIIFELNADKITETNKENATKEEHEVNIIDKTLTDNSILPKSNEEPIKEVNIVKKCTDSNKVETKSASSENMIQVKQMLLMDTDDDKIFGNKNNVEKIDNTESEKPLLNDNNNADKGVHKENCSFQNKIEDKNAQTIKSSEDEDNSELSSGERDEFNKVKKLRRKSIHKDCNQHSRRKSIMRNMHTKRMLLAHSSSSDSDNEQLTKTITSETHRGISSSDEENIDSQKKASKRQLLASDSSSESELAVSKVKKRNEKRDSDTGSTELTKNNKKKDKECSDDVKAEDNTSKTSSISQMDGNDDLSNSSEDKVRS